MSSYVVKLGGRVKDVKNLGWLLRNWQQVKSIKLTKLPGESALLEAFLDGKENLVYVSDFASYEIAQRWLKRPVFIGLPIEYAKSSDYEIKTKYFKETGHY